MCSIEDANVNFSTGFDLTKCTDIFGKACMAIAGEPTTVHTFDAKLRDEIQKYRSINRKNPSIDVLNRITALKLYKQEEYNQKLFILLAGLDSNENGIVYDICGDSFSQKSKWGVIGPRHRFLKPILDNEIKSTRFITMQSTKDIIQRVLACVSNRVMNHTGYLRFYYVTKNSNGFVQF